MKTSLTLVAAACFALSASALACEDDEYAEGAGFKHPPTAKMASVAPKAKATATATKQNNDRLPSDSKKKATATPVAVRQQLCSNPPCPD